MFSNRRRGRGEGKRGRPPNHLIHITMITFCLRPGGRRGKEGKEEKKKKRRRLSTTQ